jgi:hypothetical protein
MRESIGYYPKFLFNLENGAIVHLSRLRRESRATALIPNQLETVCRLAYEATNYGLLSLGLAITVAVSVPVYPAPLFSSSDLGILLDIYSSYEISNPESRQEISLVKYR